MNAYVNIKDYFDKYFEMGTIPTIFFYKMIILVLNSYDDERVVQYLSLCDTSNPEDKGTVVKVKI